MRSFTRTDVGKLRDVNQDYYFISDELGLYILADGMGGYAGGEIASKLATEAAARYITNNFPSINHDPENIQKLIKDAIEYANMVVYDKAKTHELLDKMGTTLEICLIYENKAYIGHIGDSRIYRIRKDIIRKITTDHSYVQKLVKDGTITKEEAEDHPKKNMLMKALGCEAYVEPDIITKGFLKEDTFLICSDGLTNMVSEEEIKRIVEEDIIKAPAKLIEKANENGGYDNITLIIIRKF